jgi:hypothetical protein
MKVRFCGLLKRQLGQSGKLSLLLLASNAAIGQLPDALLTSVCHDNGTDGTRIPLKPFIAGSWPYGERCGSRGLLQASRDSPCL